MVESEPNGWKINVLKRAITEGQSGQKSEPFGTKLRCHERLRKGEGMEKNKAGRPKVITRRLLRSRGACAVAMEIFNRAFPKGAEVTEANVKKAYDHYLDPFWLMMKFASEGLFKRYLDAHDQVDEEYGDAVVKLHSRMPMKEEVYCRRRERIDNRFHKKFAKVFVKFWEGRVRIPKKKGG